MTMSEWLTAEMESALAEGNTDRLRMMTCYSDAFELREKDPDGSFALFTEGRQLAERLNAPWWMLYYDKYRVDALVHFKRDFRQVVDMAVQCVLDLNRPGNGAYPGRIGVWDSLLAAYLGVDAEGYAEPIQQALDTLEKEIPPGPSSERYLLLARRQDFGLQLGQHADVYRYSMEALKMAAEDTKQSRGAHYATFVFCELCQIAAAIKNWEQVSRWAKAGEELAQEVGHQCERAEAVAWQSVAALHMGNRPEADRLLHSAQTTVKALGMPPNRGYYEALLRYHIGCGTLEGALAAREEELGTLENRGRLLRECQLHIDRCRLLGWLERLTPKDLEDARASASKLRQPQAYLAQLDELSAA